MSAARLETVDLNAAANPVNVAETAHEPGQPAISGVPRLPRYAFCDSETITIDT